ncbi:MAG TPA: hypothetical protein VEG44_01465 [Candidatus Acidoferrales bacterium]|nr:hypothetical protein [Candidatus Acidoferrales bacterium]
MLVLENIPFSLLGLIPGLLPLVMPIQGPINLMQVSLGYLLVQAFPDKAMLIWMALLF